MLTHRHTHLLPFYSIKSIIPSFAYAYSLTHTRMQEDAAAARAQVLAQRRREEEVEHAAAEAAVKAAEAAERAKREAEVSALLHKLICE